MTDANTICHDVDLLGDWLDAKGYTEEAGLCLRVLGLIHERDEEIEKLRSGNNEAYVFGLHKGKEAAFIDYGIERLRAENAKLRAATTELLSHYYDAMRRDGYADEEVRSEHVFLAAAAALKETGDE